jgi:propanol-preferring alcohol dehydrogenase
MLAFALAAQGGVLEAQQRPTPAPGPGEVLIRVCACGVCRTDLHVVDGDLPVRRAAVVPGHEIVGRVEALGRGASAHAIGDRVGVPWLAWTCGECRYCRSGAENLCDRAEFTGWTRDGGYAEYVVADERFCFALPPALDDVEAAPLLCAGLIGFRAWRKASEVHPVQRLGLYGFGAAAHLLAQLAIAQGQVVYAFTQPGDTAAQRLAQDLGCAWAGGSGDQPPAQMDAAILFAPVGDLVVAALKRVRKGGTVVCAGIHMTDIPSFAYADLWEERRIVSVANLTREDARDYFPLAAAAGVRPHVRAYALEDANKALEDLRRGAFVGAAVLKTDA